MFVSTFESGIDAKGRVVVPASFRAELGSSQRLFLWPAIDRGGYLEGGGEALMRSYRGILERMSPQDPNRRAFMHAIFAKSVNLSMDAGGRISLPPQLLEVAGVTDRVLFSGMLDRLQIWNPDRFAEYDEKMSTLASENQDKLDAPFMDGLAIGQLNAIDGGQS